MVVDDESLGLDENQLTTHILKTRHQHKPEDQLAEIVAATGQTLDELREI